MIVGRAEDGTRWVTTVGDADGRRPTPLARRRLGRVGRGRRRPDRTTLRHGGDPPRRSVTVSSALDTATGAPSSPTPPRPWSTAAELRQGRARPRAVAVDGRPAVRRAGRPRRPAAAASPAATSCRCDGLVGATPELLVSRARRRRPLPSDGRHRAPERRPHRRRRAWPRRSWPRQGPRRSTRSPSTWCTTRCCAGARTSTTRPSPSVVAVANVQHLATLVEGRLSSPRRLGARAGGRPAPDPGGGRLAPRRRPSPGSPRTRASTAAATPAAVGLGRRRRQRHLGGRHLRAAELDGHRGPPDRRRRRACADSDPAAELAETSAKFQALLTALVRP